MAGAGYDYSFPSILPPGLTEQQLPTAQNTAQSSIPLPAQVGFSPDKTFSAAVSTSDAQSSAPSPAGFLPDSLNISAKRKSLHMESSPESLEEASRFAAEEDKRRRNTAASARFRIKKKQREQALEKTAKELNEKVSSLELKINQLEMENKWLKNLITEKNMVKKDGTTDISELYNAKFSAAASAPAAPSSNSNSTPSTHKAEALAKP